MLSLQQLQHLLVRVNAECLDVVVAVVLQSLQVVPVVDHHAAGVVHTSPRGIGHPVNSPETGAVTEVEIGHGVERKISPFFPEEISGTQPHQDWPQRINNQALFTPVLGLQGLDNLLVDISLEDSPQATNLLLRQRLLLPSGGLGELD